MTRSYNKFALAGHQPVSRTSGDDEDAVDLGALLRTLWLGKWTIAIATAIVLGLGIYYAYRVATPSYNATSVVMLETQQEQIIDLQSVIGGLDGSDTEINTETQVLSSRSLIGQVVDALDLIKDPEFNPDLMPASGGRSFIHGVTGMLRKGPGTPAMTVEQKEKKTRDHTIDTLLAHLRIRNVPNTLVFQIVVTSTDPQKAATISDKIAELYIKDQQTQKAKATEQATQWLSSRVSELQGKLETAEEKVKNFSSNTALIDQDTLTAMEHQLKDLRSRIDTAQATAAQTAQTMKQMEAASSRQEKATAAKDPELKALLPQVSDPAKAQQFDAHFATLLQQARVAANRAKIQLQALEASRDELSGQISSQGNDLINLQQLQREAEADKTLYEYFLSRLNQTAAQEGVQQPDSRLLSSAVIPEVPSAPNKKLILFLSFFLGLVIGVAVVLIREFRQNTFRSAIELESATGHPVMGQIPLFPIRGRRNVPSYLASKPASAGAEALRDLRTSVVLSNVDNPPQIIGISSSLPGEGKTTVSLTLAQNFVSMGKKVLLIEGDIRRMDFSQYMEIDRKRPGMVSIITEQSALQDVVLHNDDIGADILASEKTHTNAADLFSSKGFENMMEEARNLYDIIIIDTPPVLIVPDARIIAQSVDAMLFVVAWDRTQKPQTQEALHLFESVGRRITGLILNQISDTGMKRYGYGGKYGSYTNYGTKYYTD